MLCQFKNIFLNLPVNARINFSKVVEIRRAKVREQGFISEDCVNWDHYARVLEAKQALLKPQ